MAGASAWRALDLYVLGRWDEAVSETLRMQRASREAELKAPWFMLNGIVAGWLLARARGDTVGADGWRAAATSIFEQSDPGIRTQRLVSLFAGDLGRLAQDVVVDWTIFTGRLDYPALALMELADHRVGADLDVLDAMVPYGDERSIRFLTAAARRLRGLLRHDPQDLAAAQAAYESMGARPFVARLRGEIGVLSGDAAGAESAVTELERIGDTRQASRLAADARAGTITIEGAALPADDRPGRASLPA